MDLSLLIMAAGIGHRFGAESLKQIEPIGPCREIILDYSVYDALLAGFNHIVFVLRRDILEDFRERIGFNIENRVDVDYVFQEDLQPFPGYSIPAERTKPLGTGHAVLSARDKIDGSFAVINADDFYGRDTFRSVAEFLRRTRENPVQKYCMAGFLLGNTLTDNGGVSRGVCEVDERNRLLNIVERSKIEKFGSSARYLGRDGWHGLNINSLVSMNFFGFRKDIFEYFEKGFKAFLKQDQEKLLTAEFYLPSVVESVIEEGKAEISVLPNGEKWYGMTYREDARTVRAALEWLVGTGKYPRKLWN
ncbi:MAG: nucleotidyltransferase [Oscillospiraceae bacterium]|jgi:NDP-sugar pyrophosphorylase family protein|nr:nucleotidyltransferase [Oscillospiraceae bacterium]